MSKSILKKDVVPFEFNDEKYELTMCRAYIQSGPVMAYRKLIGGLPGQVEMREAMLDMADHYQTMNRVQEESKAAGLSEEDTQTAVLASLPSGIFKEINLLQMKQNALENEYAQEIYSARLDMLLPALMSWNIEDPGFILPDDPRNNDEKLAIFTNYGALGEVALDAMWSWYNPTSVASEPTTEATQTADSIKPLSSTPATVNSENLPQSSLPIK